MRVIRTMLWALYGLVTLFGLMALFGVTTMAEAQLAGASSATSRSAASLDAIIP